MTTITDWLRERCWEAERLSGARYSIYYREPIWATEGVTIEAESGVHEYECEAECPEHLRQAAEIIRTSFGLPATVKALEDFARDWDARLAEGGSE